jgi:hypothetical protein
MKHNNAVKFLHSYTWYARAFAPLRKLNHSKPNLVRPREDCNYVLIYLATTEARNHDTDLVSGLFETLLLYNSTRHFHKICLFGLRKFLLETIRLGNFIRLGWSGRVFAAVGIV